MNPDWDGVMKAKAREPKPPRVPIAPDGICPSCKKPYRRIYLANHGNLLICPAAERAIRGVGEQSPP